MFYENASNFAIFIFEKWNKVHGRKFVFSPKSAKIHILRAHQTLGSQSQYSILRQKIFFSQKSSNFTNLQCYIVPLMQLKTHLTLSKFSFLQNNFDFVCFQPTKKRYYNAKIAEIFGKQTNWAKKLYLMARSATGEDKRRP